MSAQQATATGTLGATPIANLLIYALDRRLTGTLVIEDPQARKSAVSFQTGAPVKVKLPEPVALLSEVLVGMRAIDTPSATDIYGIAEKDSRLFGSVLLERTDVDAATLGDALIEQVAQKLQWLSMLPPLAVYGYYDGQDFLREFGGPEGAAVDPLVMIWRVLRLPGDLAIVDGTLSRLGSREVRLHPRSRVGRFGFDPRERGIVDVLRAKPQSIPSLIGTGILPEAQLKRVLYALVITRHLDLGAGTSPVGVEGSGAIIAPLAATAKAPISPNSPAAPASPRAADAVPPPSHVSELRSAVTRRSEALNGQNYYEILGIDSNASTGAVQAAFFQLAKKWHPDRLSPELGELRDVAIRIFARMTEAHQVLSNDEQRREYERLLREGGASDDDQEEVKRVLRAANAFQKAEVFIRRGSLAEAESQAALAVENDPGQAEYVALYADILSQKPELARSGNFQVLLKMVNEAKKKHPENARVLLYRARVLKRAGDLDGAYAEFRAVAQRDANNVEAAREVRIHQMRKGKTTTTDSRRKTGAPGKRKSKAPEKSASKDIGAMFGKLFKR
jgi:curved DNA-binding protein CbpA